MFDRFSGVKNTVRNLQLFYQRSSPATHRLLPRAPISWFHGYKKRFSLMSAPNRKYAGLLGTGLALTDETVQLIATTTGTKDLQMVQITLRVLLRPDVPQLPKIYQTLGTDYDERVVPSIGNEVLKSIVAQFDAAELITQREVVSIYLTSNALIQSIFFLGLCAYSRGPCTSRSGVSHRLRRCINHSSDLRQGAYTNKQIWNVG